MKFTESGSDEPLWIDEYSEKGFTIQNQLYPHSIILTHDKIISFDKKFPDLSLEDIEKVIDEAEISPDIIIIGSGPQHAFIKPEILMAMQEKHIGIDVMQTSSAVRTVNIMRADAREVFAFLFT